MSEKRGNLYSYDPITDLVIVGGKSLPKEERGDLDTEGNPEDPLYDAERLAMPLSESFIKGVDAFGVMNAIKITKIDGVVHVVAGRQRVRAARRVNREREKRGEAPLRVEASLMRPTSETRLSGAVILDNEARTDDEYSTKLRKLKSYMERGVDIDEAAIVFNLPTSTVKAWLTFDDNAVAELKAAVEGGVMSISAAMEIQKRAKTPEKQTEALASVILNSTPPTNGKKTKITALAARQAATRAKTPDAHLGVTDRRTMRALFQGVVDTKHPGNASKETLAWWSGVEDAFRILLGERDADPRLVAALAKVREAKEAKS